MTDLISRGDMPFKKELTDREKFEAYLSDNFKDTNERELERYTVAIKLGQCFTYPNRFDELINSCNKVKAEAIKSAIRAAGYYVGIEDNKYFIRSKSGARIKANESNQELEYNENMNNKAFFQDILGVDYKGYNAKVSEPSEQDLNQPKLKLAGSFLNKVLSLFKINK